MRVPLSWLLEMVDWPDGPEDLAEALTRRGLTVEAVERPASPPAGVLAARVLSVEPHPRADRLMLCRVSAGARGGEVVCGAPDVQAGTLVAWAAPGAVLPGGTAIGRREIRGCLSEGMVCAPDELGLPGGGGGLLRLEAARLPGHAPIAPGDDVAAALALHDPVLVFELTPNYAAHCQSILGVAREVRALTGGALRAAPDVPPEDPRAPAASAASVEVAAPDLCPRYVARVLDRLHHGPSPLQLARRLEQCGVRSLGAVVDVTNYVMLELGQPLHAFDLDALEGGGVTVRRAAPGEGIVTLDGQARELQAGELVIADAAGPVALAGVMGGRRSEVGAHTRRLLLESATFAPEAVAVTARRLGLPSEAAARFARGVDPGLARRAADRAALLLAAVAQARVHAGTIERGPGVPARSVSLRGRAARAVLGIRLSTSACGDHLARLGFDVAADGADRLRVQIPGWRPDVAIEVDLIEEVARSYGYDRLPAVLPPGEPGSPFPDPTRAAAALGREVCLGAGCSEVLPYSFHATSLWERLRLPAGHPWRQAAAIANPMHEQQAVLRTVLLAGLLQSLEANARQRRPDAAVFEVGRVFRPPTPAARPAEPLHLGLAGYGALSPGGFGHPPQPCDFLGFKGVCEEILDRFGLRACTFVPAGAALAPCHPGRAAEIRLTVQGSERIVGFVGELHPEVCRAFGLPEPAAAAELDLTALAAARREAPATAAFRPWPRFPAARRDLALLCPADLPAARVEAALRAGGGDLLADVALFDVYAGPELPPGRRSLAYTLTYQAERTLTDAEVEACQAQVRAAAAALPGVEPRS